MANRFTYGKAGPPAKVIPAHKTPSQVFEDAVQAQSANEQRSKDAKTLDRQEKEDRYTAIQQQDSRQESLMELKLAIKNLQGQIEPIKAINAQISRDNTHLSLRLSKNEQELEELKKVNQNLVLLSEVLADRVSTLEKTPIKTSQVKPATNTPVETVNFGEMTVIDGSSVRKTTSGAVSVQSGSTHTTYTPRSTYTPKASQRYFTGPRGGCFYYTASGRKEYVSRTLCN